MGDPKASAAITKLYGKTIYKKFLLPRVRQREHAMDVWQDVMNSILRSLDTFERDPEKKSFRVWVAAIARNRLVDFYRALDKHGSQLDGEHNLRDECDDNCNVIAWPGRSDEFVQGDDLEQTKLFHKVLQALRDGMDLATWEAGTRAVLGEPIERIAQDLGKTENAVTIAKSKVLRKAKIVFAEFRESLPPFLRGIEDDGKPIDPKRG